MIQEESNEESNITLKEITLKIPTDDQASSNIAGSSECITSPPGTKFAYHTADKDLYDHEILS